MDTEIVDLLGRLTGRLRLDSSDSVGKEWDGILSRIADIEAAAVAAERQRVLRLVDVAWDEYDAVATPDEIADWFRDLRAAIEGGEQPTDTQK